MLADEQTVHRYWILCSTNFAKSPKWALSQEKLHVPFETSGRKTKREMGSPIPVTFIERGCQQHHMGERTYTVMHESTLVVL